MKNKKKNLKGFARVLIFLVIFAFLYAQASNLLIPKLKDDALNKPVNMISSYKVLDNDTVDVVFFGNSNAYSGINPIKIWLDKKITSCVISTPFLTEPEIYYRAKDVLKVQSPKYIVLETDCLFETSNTFDENGYLINTEYETDDSLGISKVKTKLKNLESGIMAAVDSKYPLMKYNFRWKKIDLDEIKSATSEKAFTSRGYRASSAIKAFEYGDTYMSYRDDKEEPIDELHLKYFNKIVELCKENDIELVLMTVPSGNYWNMAKHRTVTRLAEENGLDYVDFNTDIDLLDGFDWSKDTKDGGNHMNNSGAKKVTAAYEKILTDRYGLTASDITDEQKEQWNKDADTFCIANFGSSIYKNK